MSRWFSAWASAFSRSMFALMGPRFPSSVSQVPGSGARPPPPGNHGWCYLPLPVVGGVGGGDFFRFFAPFPSSPRAALVCSILLTFCCFSWAVMGVAFLRGEKPKALNSSDDSPKLAEAAFLMSSTSWAATGSLARFAVTACVRCTSAASASVNGLSAASTRPPMTVSPWLAWRNSIVFPPARTLGSATLICLREISTFLGDLVLLDMFLSPLARGLTSSLPRTVRLFARVLPLASTARERGCPDNSVAGFFSSGPGGRRSGVGEGLRGGGGILRGAGGILRGVGGILRGAGGILRGVGGILRGAGGILRGAGGILRGRGCRRRRSRRRRSRSSCRPRGPR